MSVFADIPPERFPRHIAVIMDGNGRWAVRRGLERVRGHQQGARTVRDIVTECARLRKERGGPDYMPDPDLLVRTAGELRISNYLLWQISYAELFVSPVLWPDFQTKDLHEAIAAFASRNRRFGALDRTNTLVR